MMIPQLDLEISTRLSDDQIALLVDILDEIIAFLSRIALHLDRLRRPNVEPWPMPEWMSGDSDPE